MSAPSSPPARALAVLGLGVVHAAVALPAVALVAAAMERRRVHRTAPR